jgi:glycosyltransferase involved in cell wall biosynthesis
VLTVSGKKTTTELPLKLIFVGRISHFKGIKLLLMALSKLDSSKICLDIFGDSGEADYMADCKSLSVNMTNVKWKGRLAHEEVINTMSQYDILCLPSTFSEMSPLVVQEAFAAGIPVLASEAIGNVEQIKNSENGWLFKFNDTEYLSELLMNLVNDVTLVDKAKKNLTPVRSFKEIADEYAGVYKSFF